MLVYVIVIRIFRRSIAVLDLLDSNIKQRSDSKHIQEVGLIDKHSNPDPREDLKVDPLILDPSYFSWYFIGTPLKDLLFGSSGGLGSAWP